MPSKTLEEAQAAFMSTSILKPAVDRLQDELKAVKDILVATQNRLAIAESEKRLQELEIRLLTHSRQIIAESYAGALALSGKVKMWELDSIEPSKLIAEAVDEAENAIREEQEAEDDAS
jgi:hypothetical protein